MTPSGANKSTAALDAATPAGAAPEAALQADIDSLLTSIDKTADRVQEKAAPADISPKLNTLLADAAPAPPPPHPSPDALEALDNLDAQLAELTAELLTPTPTPPAPVEAHEPAPATAPAPTPPAATTSAVALTPAPASVAHAPTPEAAKPAPVPTVSAVAQDTATSLTPSAAAASAKPQSRGPGPIVRLLTPLSRPLLAKPRHVRTVVALFAINSLLLAGAVWAYLIFRTPADPTHGPAFNLSTDTLPRPVEPKADTPPAKDAHSAAPKKADTAKPAGKSKPAEHH